MEEAEQVMRNVAPQPGGKRGSTSAASSTKEEDEPVDNQGGSGNADADALVSEVLRDMGAPPSPS